MVDTIAGIVAEMDIVIGMGIDTVPGSLRNLRDRLAALLASGVVVPREPTAAMIEAGRIEITRPSTASNRAHWAYAAMLAAAPTPSDALAGVLREVVAAHTGENIDGCGVTDDLLARIDALLSEEKK